ncbi:hypothetical protein GGX14DRAFT_451427 [Mycena pura]|uniref:Uncharacterized protein n=1 Tax=Mycena pura TaxID=153505 RepID=A0AAD6YD53_9AGAR|nr:hypothetical protein GGX14DRAFT_451427 [Mycena pura]
MCNDGNSALQSIRYLNAQLAALWENADDCAKQAGKDPNFKSEHWEKGKYTRALAQYHYLGKKSASKVTGAKDLLFCASFGKPTLEVICNHELILHLTVKDGHVNTEFLNANKSGYRVEPKNSVSVDGLQVSYRMSFSRTSIKGRDTKIGNHDSKHLIQLMILDIDSAKLVKSSASLPIKVKDALAFYLFEYLHFLRSAGNHVLFDLPDFDDNKFSPNIDYSLVSTALEVDEFCCDTVHDTSLSDINKYLYDKWLIAATLGRPRDVLSICLAEISSTWLMNTSIDTHFHIRFGAPHTKALCSNEVLLHFTIEDIAFFGSSDFSQKPLEIYHGWKIAFIVDVVQEKVGSVTKLKLDFGSARYSRHFSVVTETTGIAVAYFEKIVKFLTVDYLDVLTSYSLHVVHDVDLAARPLVGFESEGGGVTDGGVTDGGITDGHAGSSEGSEHEHEHEHEHGHEHEHEHEGLRFRRKAGSITVRTERIAGEKLVLGGYDQVLALSERSIKDLFVSYYRQAGRGKALYEQFVHWKSDLFSAHFNVLDVRLLSNDRAIVWVNIHDGELAIESTTEHRDFWTYIGFKKATSAKTVKRQFSDVAIAYEVDLKFVEHKELSVEASWQSIFEKSYLYRAHQSERASRLFKHLILDFENAKHVPQLSITGGLHGVDREAVLKLETVLHYTQEYLQELSHHGHHIIHSIPVFTAKTNTSSFGLTSVTYQLVTKSQVTIETCRRVVKASEAPVILVLGMFDFRTMPTVQLSWIQGWVISEPKCLGTICLSRDTFLERHLLKLLALLNKKTTLVPEWAGIVNGDWQYQITTLENHSRRKNDPNSWRFHKRADKSREYVWEHRDDWNHESKHEAITGEERTGAYCISCHTTNKLSIPTVYHQGSLEITLGGESTLKISKRTDGVSWSKKTCAKWSAVIAFHSRADGLHIEVVGGEQPVFTEIESDGECPIDVKAEHRKHLPAKIDLQDILLDLRALLQGPWEYSYPGMEAYALSNPVFTHDGDLIMDLSAYSSTSSSSSGSIFTKAKSAISNFVTSPSVTTPPVVPVPPAAAPQPTPPTPVVKPAVPEVKPQTPAPQANGGKKPTVEAAPSVADAHMQASIKETMAKLNLRPCPQGYEFVKVKDGYRCNGGNGSHFISFEQLGMN